MALKISESMTVQMPMKTVISLIVIAIGEHGLRFPNCRASQCTQQKFRLMEKDLEENTLFRIKWPRGEMGSLPADSEQFMMLEEHV